MAHRSIPKQHGRGLGADRRAGDCMSGRVVRGFRGGGRPDLP